MPDPQEKQDTPFDGGAAASKGAAPPEAEAGLVFTSLDKFYDDYLSQIAQRPVDGVHLA
ncbi:hypothetical protein [Streptomyces sp. IBSBF 2435]|uniref:hypothetical protein n=1 Tax=Streptomyces sp. IBSBF 2435 TaxID=2903531 RepID=UPI002FDC56F5